MDVIVDSHRPPQRARARSLRDPLVGYPLEHDPGDRFPDPHLITLYADYSLKRLSIHHRNLPDLVQKVESWGDLSIYNAPGALNMEFWRTDRRRPLFTPLFCVYSHLQREGFRLLFLRSNHYFN